MSHLLKRYSLHFLGNRWCSSGVRTPLPQGSLAAFLNAIPAESAGLNCLRGLDQSDVAISQFEHGQSNPTYLLRVKSSGESFVLRKKPPGKLLPSAHAVEREYKVISALSNAGVAVPHVHWLCEDPSLLGTPFYVMEYVSGAIYKDPMLPNVPSADARTGIYRNLADTLASIHGVDPMKAGLGDYGAMDGSYMHRQLRRWGKQYEASKTHEIKAMDQLIAYLNNNCDRYSSARTSVVHGDFRLDNCVFDKDSNKVLAVLDWELSTLGDPLTDLAYACLPYYFPDDATPPLRGVTGGQLGIPSQRTFVEDYLSKAAIAGISDDMLNFHVAFSLFRVAAILQGVYKRALQGNASSANAKQVGAFAEFMAEAGWRLVDSSSSSSAEQGGVATSDAKPQENKKGNSTNGPAYALPGMTPRVCELRRRLMDFMDDNVYPNESYFVEHARTPQRWEPPELLSSLKAEAKKQNLWNLFLPLESDPQQKYGAGLTNVEYAHLCEVMGRSLYAPELFNCSAPDTGNMEVLARYGTEEQKEKWLKPLLAGEIRSCFGMTEPQVASSDATNIGASIILDESRGEYVVNGRKWFTSGAMDPRCKVMICMGKTDENARRHQQQAMILIPMPTEGLEIIRPLHVFGYDDAPHGHAEISLTDVRVPAENMILGPGRGFEIAQGRLGPGRIHHCMRLIGAAERALELMMDRVQTRVAFGKPLARQDTIRRDIAESRLAIDQARLLTLHAAAKMDAAGNKAAAPEIAMIKILAPRMALDVIDRAIQAHGGAGVSQDTPLAHLWAMARTLRLADGPDEVHTAALASMELKRFNAARSSDTL